MMKDGRIGARQRGKLTRRELLGGGAALGLAAVGGVLAANRVGLTGGGRSLAAGTPSADRPSKELTIAVSADGITVPDQITPGRYLVTVENAMDEGITVDLLLPPAEVDPEQAFADMSAADGPPAWLGEAMFAGGPYARTQNRAQSIVDLVPGEWIVWGERSAPAPQRLSVVASYDDEYTPFTPESQASVTMTEYGFAGLDAVQPGAQTWMFHNAGAQPHMMDLIKAPHPVTKDDMMALLMTPDGQQPPAGVPRYDEFEGIAGIGNLSPFNTAWLLLPELSAGTYVALCFVPDAGSGMPHALMGMIEVFTIS